jgi:hypothetical protein
MMTVAPPSKCSPSDDLRAFLGSHALPGADIETAVILVQEALGRFKEPIMTAVEIARKAKRLADAAAKFARALEVCADVKIHKDGSARLGQSSVWPYLRIAELMGCGGFGDDVGSALRFGQTTYSARRFDVAAGGVWSLLFQVRAIAERAEKARRQFSPPKRPPDSKIMCLRFEFETIWHKFTGRPPGYSGAARFDAPRSHFGRFTRLALETTDWDHHECMEIFKKLMGGKSR